MTLREEVIKFCSYSCSLRTLDMPFNKGSIQTWSTKYFTNEQEHL